MIGNFLHKRVLSFRYAFSGWWYVIRTQQNAWIHATVSVVVILFALAKAASRLAVITSPCHGMDRRISLIPLWKLWSTSQPTRATSTRRVGKDVGAAAVLIAAIASAVIGALILLPALWIRLQALFSNF
jgi:diacylglycerol kinase